MKKWLIILLLVFLFKMPVAEFQAMTLEEKQMLIYLMSQTYVAQEKCQKSVLFLFSFKEEIFFFGECLPEGGEYVKKSF